jgi:GNAT superfamily N-acetyltransferase
MQRAFLDQPFARTIYGENRLARWKRLYDEYAELRWHDYPVTLAAVVGSLPVGVVLASPPGACVACKRASTIPETDDPVAALNSEFERNVAAVHAAEPAHAWITKMVVEPALQRLGIGRRLLDAAVAAFPAGTAVLLECEPQREAFYLAAGFRRVRTFPDPAGPDAVLLRCDTGT